MKVEVLFGDDEAVRKQAHATKCHRTNTYGCLYFSLSLKANIQSFKVFLFECQIEKRTLMLENYR